MADSAGTAVLQSRQADSSENKDDAMDVAEPEPKKCKYASKDQPVESKLEDRLSGILCCAVCLDVPCLWMYQCTNGHLMCASCLSHLLADARLKDETPTCPGCRCEISRTLCSRNLAVEKAISELPALCQFCARSLPRSMLSRHESEMCQDRQVRCPYARLGCQWAGQYHKLASHESACAHPHKTGAELMEQLRVLEEQRHEEVKLYKLILDFMSCEKVVITDIQLRPYRTDDFIPKLYYEATRFSAHTYQWTVKARVNDNQDNPVHMMNRSISYQLILKSKPSSTLSVTYFTLTGPFGDTSLSPAICEFEFGPDALESPYNALPLTRSSECNRLLAAKTINFRLVLVQTQK